MPTAETNSCSGSFSSFISLRGFSMEGTSGFYSPSLQLGVDDHEVQGTRADEGVSDFEGLLAVVGL